MNVMYTVIISIAILLALFLIGTVLLLGFIIFIVVPAIVIPIAISKAKKKNKE